jgi:dienelactone hydrolase
MHEADPFARGPAPVGVRTLAAHDAARRRSFPCELWYPADERHRGQDVSGPGQDAFAAGPSAAVRRQAAVRGAAPQAGNHPLIVFSHSSGAGRRSATFLCTHLASHGYAVAALDHSEVVAPELARREGESDAQRDARWQAVIASRVPDVQCLLAWLLAGRPLGAEVSLDAARLGLAGHSFGGWTALAVPDAEPRVRAVVALAPGGASQPRPGILPCTLRFAWGREVPTLYVVAEGDTSLPLAGMRELHGRTPGARRMVVLRRADHMHFLDDVETQHESFRTMPLKGALARIQREMLPIAQLCPGEQAHLAVRGLALAHFDAALRESAAARRLLDGDVAAEVAARGVDVRVEGVVRPTG